MCTCLEKTRIMYPSDHLLNQWGNNFCTLSCTTSRKFTHISDFRQIYIIIKYRYSICRNYCVCLPEGLNIHTNFTSQDRSDSRSSPTVPLTECLLVNSQEGTWLCCEFTGSIHQKLPLSSCLYRSCPFLFATLSDHARVQVSCEVNLTICSSSLFSVAKNAKCFECFMIVDRRVRENWVEYGTKCTHLVLTCGKCL